MIMDGVLLEMSGNGIYILCLVAIILCVKKVREINRNKNEA
jgi:hypothetical protein